MSAALRAALRAGAASALLATLFACAPPSEGAPAASPELAAAAKTWRARCGACHTRVEPGARTRAQLEVALARHHKRVRLPEEEWRELVTFLAKEPPPAASAAEPAPFPAPDSTPATLFPVTPSPLNDMR